MATAYKHGHVELKDLPEGAREAVKRMAQMSDDSLDDFTHVAKHRPKTRSLLGGTHKE
jgi:hypothetical protein